YTRGRLVAVSSSSSARAAPDRRRAAVINGASPHRTPKQSPIPLPSPRERRVQRSCLGRHTTGRAGGRPNDFARGALRFPRKGTPFSGGVLRRRKEEKSFTRAAAYGCPQALRPAAPWRHRHPPHKLLADSERGRA